MRNAASAVQFARHAPAFRHVYDAANGENLKNASIALSVSTLLEPLLSKSSGMSSDMPRTTDNTALERITAQ